MLSLSFAAHGRRGDEKPCMFAPFRELQCKCWKLRPILAVLIYKFERNMVVLEPRCSVSIQPLDLGPTELGGENADVVRQEFDRFGAALKRRNPETIICHFCILGHPV